MREAINVGETYMFHGRMIYLGRVVEVTLLDVVINEACWMEDMGIPMSDLMKNGIAEETNVEVFEPELCVPIPRGGFVPIPWKHKLPKDSQ